MDTVEHWSIYILDVLANGARIAAHCSCTLYHYTRFENQVAMHHSLLFGLALPWVVLGQTHLLCPADTASGSNLVVDASFEETYTSQYWTLKQGMYTGKGTFSPADGSSYFIIPVGGVEGNSGYFQQNVTVELDTRYYGSIQIRPRVLDPANAQLRTPTPRTCTATAALQGAIGGTFEDTATFYIKPDAVFGWETLGFDFKNPFSGSVRFLITTSCDGPMASLEMDFDAVLVQRVDAPDACSNVDRPVPITGSVTSTPSPTESAATPPVSSTVSPTTITPSKPITSVTSDPAVSTVQVTITAAPVTSTTYTTVFVVATTTSTVTVYASTATETVTTSQVVATTTVTVTATQPVTLRRRRGCRPHTASNTVSEPSATSSTAETSASSSASASASDSASDSTAVSSTATSSSDTTSSMTITATPSSTSTSSVIVTSTTTTTVTVTPTVTVDGGSSLVELPAPTATVTEPVTTVTETATASVTSTSTVTPTATVI